MAASNLNDWVSLRLEELAQRDLRPVEVAVIDSGIDSSHPDLAGRIVEAVRVDASSGNADIISVELGQNNDQFGHGTAVASIIAKLAPNAHIVDVRVLGETSTGSAGALIAGLKYAVQRRSRLINMSLAAKAEHAATLRGLCETAYRHNQLIIAARRNMPLTDEGIPAEFSSTISVDRDRFPTPYQLQFRPDQTIEYSALGEEVIVAASGGGYTTKTGTSFATPAIAAMCALLIGAHPELRPFEVKTILKAFAGPVSNE